MFPRAQSFERCSNFIYITPLRRILSGPTVCHHLYDDIQFYITLSKSKPEMSLSLLQDCLLGVGDLARSGEL